VEAKTPMGGKSSSIHAAEVIGFGDSLIFVNNPTAIQEILTSKKFTAPGEVNGILKPLVGNYSILVISGDRHKKHRQLLSRCDTCPGIRS